MKRFTLVFLICGTMLLSATAQMRKSFKPTGKMIDAGGHKLHMNIQGKGEPVVVFENGSGDFSFIWSLVQPKISKITKTVSYDRAGYAWSEPGPIPRTGAQLVTELHTALKNAGIKGPYILVGQSFGGFLVRHFARLYPSEVAGMVLVEAVHEDGKILIGGKPTLIREFASGKTIPAPIKYYKSDTTEFADASQLDTAIYPPMDRLPMQQQKMQVYAQSQEFFRKTSENEMMWSSEDVANLYKHKDDAQYKLGNIPLIVLTREKGGYDGRSDSLELEKDRLEKQYNLSQLSTNGKHIVVKDAGHNIHLEKPEVVIEAIEEVIKMKQKSN